MALSDDVQDRYGTEFLVNLTNPFAPDQTSIDTARLGLASTDVESDLILYCGMTYSSMQALANLAGPCTSVAVEGVVAKLQIRTGAAGATLSITFRPAAFASSAARQFSSSGTSI